MNEITITGNLVTTPVLRTYATQDFTKFRLAHNHSYRDASTGDWIDRGTTFIDVTCWRKLAVNVCESIGKGSAVIITGRLKSSEWEKEVDGRTEKRTSFEIEATTIGPDLSRGATQAQNLKHEAVVRQEESAVAEALASVASGSPFEPVPGEVYPAA